MKKYLNPQIEILLISNSDVLTASGFTVENQPGNGDSIDWNLIDNFT